MCVCVSVCACMREERNIFETKLPGYFIKSLCCFYVDQVSFSWIYIYIYIYTLCNDWVSSNSKCDRWQWQCNCLSDLKEWDGTGDNSDVTQCPMLHVEQETAVMQLGAQCCTWRNTVMMQLSERSPDLHFIGQAKRSSVPGFTYRVQSVYAMRLDNLTDTHRSHCRPWYC